MDVMKVSVESSSEAQCWRARVTFLSNVSTGGSSESQKTSLTRTLSSGSLYSPLRLARICVVTGRCKKNIDILFWSIINLITHRICNGKKYKMAELGFELGTSGSTSLVVPYILQGKGTRPRETRDLQSTALPLQRYLYSALNTLLHV